MLWNAEEGRRYDPRGLNRVRICLTVFVAIYVALTLIGMSVLGSEAASARAKFDMELERTDQDFNRERENFESTGHFSDNFLKPEALDTSKESSDAFTASLDAFINADFLIIIVGGITTYIFRSIHLRAVAVAKEQELNKARDIALDIKYQMELQTKAMEKLQSASKMGDFIIQGNHAPVTISDSVIQSYNTIVSSDPELASVVKTLAGYIEESKNTEAASYFEELHPLLGSGAKKKSTIKSLWNSIVGVLPGVLELTDVATKMKSLIDGTGSTGG
jgi:hypothetical protein